MKRVKRYPAHRVYLTGGSPSVLREFVPKLDALGLEPTTRWFLSDPVPDPRPEDILSDRYQREEDIEDASNFLLLLPPSPVNLWELGFAEARGKRIYLVGALPPGWDSLPFLGNKVLHPDWESFQEEFFSKKTLGAYSHIDLVILGKEWMLEKGNTGGNRQM